MSVRSRREPNPTQPFLPPAAPAYGAPSLHLVLRAGEAHRAAMATAGKGCKGKAEAMPVYPQDYQPDAGHLGPFAPEYSLANNDKARMAWWHKVKVASKASKTPIHNSKLTWRVDQYLRGCYKAKNGRWYHSNTPKHRAAALLFYNKFIASDMPSANHHTLQEWPNMYEKGMLTLGAL